MKLINKKSYCTEATKGSLTDTHPLHTHTAITLLPEVFARGRGTNSQREDIPLLFIVSVASTCTVQFPNQHKDQYPSYKSHSTSQPVTKLHRFYATH